MAAVSFSRALPHLASAPSCSTSASYSISPFRIEKPRPFYSETLNPCTSNEPSSIARFNPSRGNSWFPSRRVDKRRKVARVAEASGRREKREEERDRGRRKAKGSDPKASPVEREKKGSHGPSMESKGRDRSDHSHGGSSSRRKGKVFSRQGRVWTSGAIEIEDEKVLQDEEIITNPLWTTFSSSTAGVWKGVAASFSPITGELEPIGLGLKGEYLYDAKTTCTVTAELSRAHATQPFPVLRRVLTWRVGNLNGEQVESEGEGFDSAGVGAVMELTREDLEMMYRRSGGTEEEETEESIEDEEELGVGEEGEEEMDFVGAGMDEDNEEELLEEEGEEWEDGNGGERERMEQSKGRDVTNQAVPAREMEPPLVEGGAVVAQVEESSSTGEATGGEEGEEEAVEEDEMGWEAGLVFFEDGSYSRGPLELLPDRGRNEGRSEQEYVVLPTFQFEQCVVRGGHTRLRMQHTIAVHPEGEDMEVLRVAVYEEEWMGPTNMRDISDSSGSKLKPLSERPRIRPESLKGPWKVFEVLGTILEDGGNHESGAQGLGVQGAEKSEGRPTLVHSCRETLRVNGAPTPAAPYMDQSGTSIEDVSLLWLPDGITSKLDVDEEDGTLTVGVGWLAEDGTRLYMERVYDPNGRLLEVLSGSEVKGGWVGGRM